ncbi:MAG: endonuclease MutS2 [Marinifilaceae bacterium]
MIYPQNFESKIKFDKVRQLIAAQCMSGMGRELVLEMQFSSDAEVIGEKLAETNEFMRVLREEESFPSCIFNDSRTFLNKIRIEGLFPDVAELVGFKNSLESIHAVVRFFATKSETYPTLTAKSGAILLFPYVLERLNAIVSKHGTIKDSASRELADIRQQLQRKQSTISKRMQSLLQMAQQEGWADKDTSIAIRDGRMVIPVPSAYKRKIGGIVHDESATGKTSYIEPTEIVETNNEIRELELEERREIMRILRQFADDIRPYIDDLIAAFDFLAYVDFVRAKAQFALSVEAIVPQFTDRPEMLWYGAKHPLLYLTLKAQNKEVVPLKLEIVDEDRIVLISGPNAGGKSVCLQTAGILQYMFQCGMPVPVNEASRFGVFKKILIDMGDEQSIDNDLSTYSSHLINMKNFLRYGDNETLILIDEFGTGTEPMLGGAIAESILAQLNTEKVKGVITTHYTNLKHFAQSQEGIVNGAMLYDAQHLQPLFKLEVGKPGSSFAFEIAKKIGLPASVLEDAKQKIGGEHIDYDKHLKEIARDKRYWEEKRRRIHENEKKLDKVVERYSSELDEASKMKKEIIREAQQKAKEIIETANKEIERTIKEIRENQANKEKTRELRKKLEQQKEALLIQSENEQDDKIRRKMDKIREREERKAQRQPKGTAGNVGSSEERTIEIGDNVRLKNGAIGEVIQIDGRNAVVALGLLRTTVKVADITRVSSNQAKKSARPVSTSNLASFREELSKKRMNFKGEIDVRGMRADDAVQAVEEFVDEAAMLDFKDIRILHGTGTGVLRQMIRAYLHTHPHVMSAVDEQVQLGGAGITVVKMK